LLFSCQLPYFSTAYELYFLKMYLQKHPSTFCSWLFWLRKAKWLTGFKIIALYIFSEVYAWLKQKANLWVLTERWLNRTCSRNNAKTATHTMGGCPKPVCAPSFSGQIPALLWDRGESQIKTWLLSKGSYSWGAPPSPLCLPRQTPLPRSGETKCIRALPCSWWIAKPAHKHGLGGAF